MPHDPDDDRDPESRERRRSERLEVTWSVDCETEETFLYASITNISEMGIFVRTTEPLPVGTELTLRFSPPASHRGLSGDPIAEFVLRGAVQWINPATSGGPNPGMGIRFAHLSPEDRERIVDTIRTIAYLRDGAASAADTRAARALAASILDADEAGDAHGPGLAASRRASN